MDSLQSKISEIIQFLTQNNYILTSHLTEAYLKNHFANFPQEWFEELTSFSYSEFLQILNYTEKAIDLSPNFPNFSNEIPISVVESVGMSPKKIHEASRLACFIIEEAKAHKISKIIDIGAGQGYLSHLLVSSAALSVTAIEGKEHNSEKSKQRALKINKSVKTTGNFETVCQMITSENISEIANDPCILIGLHTCGDLASNSLKLFLQSPLIKGVINVGCCYHHLTEYVENQDFISEYLAQIGESSLNRCLDQSLVSDPHKAGFPLSDFVRKIFSQGFFLGKLVRSLCISEPSDFSLKNAEKNFKKLEYRAAFQSFLARFFPGFEKTFALGNKIRKFNDFAEYTKLALQKMGLDTEMNFEEINRYYLENFKEHEKKISILWVLRSVLSGAVENLIVLDRILFFQERNIETQTFAVFDKQISPRNLVICGFKP